MTPTPRPYYGAVSGPEGIVERDNEIARLTAELAEAKAETQRERLQESDMEFKMLDARRQRDAALVQSDGWKASNDNHIRQLNQARAEADALRVAAEKVVDAQNIGTVKDLNEAMEELANFLDDRALNSEDKLPRYSEDKARLAPALAPNPRDGLCATAEPLKWCFEHDGQPPELRCDKPAPETAMCVWKLTTASAGPWCETHNRFDEHGATVKAEGPVATAPIQPGTNGARPAAESAPCPDHRPELQWLCETCGERTAPRPPKEP